MKLISLLFTLAFCLQTNAFFEPKIIEESVWIEDRDGSILQQFSTHPEFVIDHVSEDGFELYGPLGTSKYLLSIGIDHQDIDADSFAAGANYPSFKEIESELKSLANHYQSNSKLYSIGKSEQGRDLWVMKLAKDAHIENDTRAAFKYIANMHGDEIVGRELMVRFIRDVLEKFEKDERITRLLETTQIHILVSMNPDGAEYKRRGNARWVDLNRSFPDFSTRDNQNTTSGRPAETVAVMNWQSQYNFLLSANFHGGAEVVNYPWDTVATKFPHEALVKDLSLEYASNAPYIASSTAFENGITNGYAWYEVNGGMQDWSYYWYGDLQITVELSNRKWPSYDMIDYYYNQNREALIQFVERIHTL